MSKGILDEIFDVSGWDEEDLSPLKEAPDDEQPSGGDAPADDNGDDANADNNAEDAEQDQNADDNAEDQGDDNQDNDDQQDNFDIDTDNADDGEGEDQPEDDQEAPADGGADETEPDEEASQQSQNLKDMYDQLYKDLTPEERAYRNMVLKNEYKDLHTICGSILMQTGYFPNVAETQPLLKRVIKSLQSFRKYISFYLTNIYDTKSFYENKYQYEVYLQIFNGIKGIFQDLEKMMSHQDDESSKEKRN